MIESIYAHPDFASENITMIELSLTSNKISSNNVLPILSPRSQTITSTSYSDQNVVFIQNSFYTSDINYETNDMSYSVVENTNIKIVVDVPCSKSGTTSIIYSLISCNGGTVPSFASIDSSTGILNLQAPKVNSTTSYTFWILSTISGVSISPQKLISLTIHLWSVQNWQYCQVSNSSLCSKWSDGYSLEFNKWVYTSNIATINNIPELNTEAQVASTTTQSVYWATTVTITTANILSTTSISAIWSILNQVQVFFLLQLTQAFIPDCIQLYITGPNYALNPFGSFTLGSSITFQSPVDKFNINLSNPLMTDFGINSQSSVYNTYSTLWWLIWVLLIHLLIFFIIKRLERCNENNRYPRLLRITKHILIKVFEFLTFGYYIRVMLQLNQFFLITTLNEIVNFSYTNIYGVLSLIYAIFLLIFWLVFIVLILCLSISSYEIVEGKHNKLEEVFADLKHERRF